MRRIGSEPELSVFQIELKELLNKHGKENGSDTPDFILAGYLMGVLDAFEDAVAKRTQWYAPPEAVPCPSCGQVPEGHTGEYPCPTCGLPTLWDEPGGSETT